MKKDILFLLRNFFLMLGIFAALCFLCWLPSPW